MLKRSGFSRKLPDRQPLPAPRPVRQVAPISFAVVGQPKSAPHRNRSLLEMARGKPCLLMIPGVCQGGGDTTVACHSNSRADGKAGARKADDEYSVWGCFACHNWLDTGPALSGIKAWKFARAHILQRREWREIAAGPPSKDQRAAQWALDKLGIKYNATS